MKRLLPLAVVLVLNACASAPPKPAPDALYRALGGQDGIAKFVDAALVRIHGDVRINLFFENTDMSDLRRLLIEQVCAASGGPCTYTGRSMEDAHSGLNLTDDDFDAFVEDIIAAMNDVHAGPDAQKQVLGLFGAMKPQVVGQ